MNRKVLIIFPVIDPVARVALFKELRADAQEITANQRWLDGYGNPVMTMVLPLTHREGKDHIRVTLENYFGINNFQILESQDGEQQAHDQPDHTPATVMA